MKSEIKKRFTWSSFKIDSQRHIFCVVDNLHILPVERFVNTRENGALIPYNRMKAEIAEYCKELNAQCINETTKTETANDKHRKGE